MAKLKISYPVFRHAPAVILGRGSLRSLQDLSDSDTTFLLSGDESVRRHVGDAVERAGGALSPENCLEKPAGEPTVTAIREAAAFLSGRPNGRLVAIGGGSVLDWARLSWAEARGVIDLGSGVLDQPSVGEQRPKFWLIPTTCGTGAEAADVVVYTRDDGTKASVVSPAFMAQLVVLDGGLLDTISAPEMAAFVCDALSHALESFLSVVPNALAKESALSALGLIFANFSPDPDRSQKDRLLEASFLAGVAAANCSVGIVHSFAHTIGAAGMSHGLANACALESGLAFNSQTPQMKGLLERLGLESVDSIIERIRPITEYALQNIEKHPLANRLREIDFRSEIAERMSEDITIRSNPRRPTAGERVEFVASVAARLSIQ